MCSGAQSFERCQARQVAGKELLRKCSVRESLLEFWKVSTIFLEFSIWKVSLYLESFHYIFRVEYLESFLYISRV